MIFPEPIICLITMNFRWFFLERLDRLRLTWSKQNVYFIQREKWLHFLIGTDLHFNIVACCRHKLSELLKPWKVIVKVWWIALDQANTSKSKYNQAKLHFGLKNYFNFDQVLIIFCYVRDKNFKNIKCNIYWLLCILNSKRIQSHLFQPLLIFFLKKCAKRGKFTYLTAINKTNNLKVGMIIL